jgi:hypothetical protein
MAVWNKNKDAISGTVWTAQRCRALSLLRKKQKILAAVAPPGTIDALRHAFNYDLRRPIHAGGT